MEIPWGKRGEWLYFNRNDGISKFKRHSLEYDDFIVFFGKFTKAKPVSVINDQYLREALVLFEVFQKKKMESQRVKMQRDRAALPVHAFQSTIVEAVKANRVVLIAADTGAGKSTQVPQFLMEAGFDKICCTQPRRIACFSLAKRVATESLNQYGSRIAYQVRFDGSKSNDTKVLFLTEGVLLRQFAQDPLLKQYNVIIVDEVHERSRNSDFLLGILKRVLNNRLDLKIVLMSATINAELFSKYFNAPVIQIPGRMFPVSIEYHPFLEKDTNLTDPKLISERKGSTIVTSIASKPIKIKPGPFLKILERIDEKVPETERGDLLIFVSGMYEIQILAEELRQYAQSTRRWIILELHSALSIADQEKVFDIAPEGVRKCIISTNIAETSVTIDGIRFIIDSGKVKEMAHDSVMGVSKLSEFWISQSSAKQRAGRAGRTGPGECYRLYSKEEYDGLNDFPVPEIHRMPMESIILDILAMELGDPQEFDFIEKPPEESFSHSIRKLTDLGCIDPALYEITDLGRVLSKLPLDAVLGKMLILGLISALLNPIIILTAVMSVQSPFTRLADSVNSRVMTVCCFTF